MTSVTEAERAVTDDEPPPAEPILSSRRRALAARFVLATRSGPVLRFAPALLPAFAMLVVGRFRLMNPALGWDENATWMVSRRSVAEIFKMAGNMDGVIAPYYLFMHYWMAVFGDSELSLRAPSLIATAVGVGLAGELGRRLFGAGVGLAAGAFLVVVPNLTRYAQDARAYGLAFMFAVLATLLLYLALEKPGRLRWIAYGLSITLLGLTHMLGLLVLTGHAVAIGTRWWRDRDRSVLAWLPTTAIAVIPVIPLVLIGLSQRGKQLDWVAEITVAGLPNVPGSVFASGTMAMLIIGLAIAVRVPERRRVRELAAMAALPPVLLIGVSFLTSSLWVPRYVLFIIAPLCLLAAAALRDRPGRTVFVLALAILLSWPAHVTMRGDHSHVGMNFRAAARYVAKWQQPGDGIVYGRIGTWGLRSGIEYQLRNQTGPRDLLLQQTAASVGELEAVECPDPQVCIGDTKRVWLVAARRNSDPLNDAGPVLKALFAANYTQSRQLLIDKGSIVLFERR